MKKSFFILFTIINSFSIAQIDSVKIFSERISERILIVWGGEIYKDQVAAIATEKGIVMIDAGKSPSLTKKYRKIIEKEFGRDDFKYVINTHYHFDHTSGNQVFLETEIIAHKKSIEGMIQFDQNRKKFVESRRDNQMKKWISELKEAELHSAKALRLWDYITTGIVMLDDFENNYNLTLPTITFSDELKLDLGDITLNLYYWGEGLHTGDDILINCPEEKILFSGDLFYKGSFGFAFSDKFDVERWISVLDKIFNYNEIEWIYDCHNGKMTGGYIALYHNYIKDVWTSLKKAKEENKTIEEIFIEYSFEDRFTYLTNSGLSEEELKRDHEMNIKNTWISLNK